MIAHGIDGKNTVKIRRRRAEGNQRVHVGGSVGQCLKADYEEFLIDDEDRRCQQELGQGEKHDVFVACQDRRQGSAHHMPHGKIKQGDEEAERGEQTVFHGLHFLQSHVFRRFCSGFCTLQACAVAAASDGVDDIVCGEGSFVIFHHHAVLQKVYADGDNTFQFPHCLFHMGRAGGTGHARHVEFLFQIGTPPLFFG